MSRLIVFCAVCLKLALNVSGVAFANEDEHDEVACLLEENASELLPKLTNPGGDPGHGEVEKSTVFSGESAVKISVLQRYCNFIDGWAYRIRESPQKGEYRYLRFAWKADHLTGIMLQLHDQKDWHIRYVAGANSYGWTSQTVAESPPAEWALVTVDLFKDFGDRKIHGIAFTMFEGNAGYFDHVYLGRSIEALDAIDVFSFGKGGPLSLEEDEVNSHFDNLASADASRAYRAYWTLAAGDMSVRTRLTSLLGGARAEVNAEQLAAWLSQLDHDDYAIRKEATIRLMEHLPTARERLQAALSQTTSLEVRYRLELILEQGQQHMGDLQHREAKARRIITIIEQRSSK